MSEEPETILIHSPFSFDSEGIYAGILFSIALALLITYTLCCIKSLLFRRPSTIQQLQRSSNGSRFSRDPCCICLEDTITLPVISGCMHAFCGQCIMNCWQSINKAQLSCPCCRRRMNLLYTDFDESQATTREQKQMVEQLKEYNTVYSGQPRSIPDMIRDTPFFIRVLFARMWGWSNFFFVLTALFRTSQIFGAILYILSPVDLIPEASLGPIGYVDDLVAAFIILVLLANISYRLIRSLSTQGSQQQEPQPQQQQEQQQQQQQEQEGELQQQERSQSL